MGEASSTMSISRESRGRFNVDLQGAATDRQGSPDPLDVLSRGQLGRSAITGDKEPPVTNELSVLVVVVALFSHGPEVVQVVLDAVDVVVEAISRKPCFCCQQFFSNSRPDNNGSTQLFPLKNFFHCQCCKILTACPELCPSPCPGAPSIKGCR